MPHFLLKFVKISQRIVRRNFPRLASSRNCWWLKNIFIHKVVGCKERKIVREGKRSHEIEYERRENVSHNLWHEDEYEVPKDRMKPLNTSCKRAELVAIIMMIGLRHIYGFSLA